MIITGIITICSRIYASIGYEITNERLKKRKTIIESKFTSICHNCLKDEDSIIKYLRQYLLFSLIITMIIIIIATDNIKINPKIIKVLIIEFTVLLLTTIVVLKTKNETINNTNSFLLFLKRKRHFLVTFLVLFVSYNLITDSTQAILNNELKRNEIIKLFIVDGVEYLAVYILAIYLLFHGVPFIISSTIKMLFKKIIQMSLAPDDGNPLRHFFRIIGLIISIAVGIPFLFNYFIS